MLKEVLIQALRVVSQLKPEDISDVHYTKNSHATTIMGWLCGDKWFNQKGLVWGSKGEAVGACCPVAYTKHGGFRYENDEALAFISEFRNPKSCYIFSYVFYLLGARPLTKAEQLEHTIRRLKLCIGLLSTATLSHVGFATRNKMACAMDFLANTPEGVELEGHCIQIATRNLQEFLEVCHVE